MTLGDYDDYSLQFTISQILTTVDIMLINSGKLHYHYEIITLLDSPFDFDPSEVLH